MSGLSRRAVLLGLGAALALPLAGCALPAPAPRLTMACGERGGSYLLFGELLQGALARRRGAELDPLETNGSAENLDLLADGTADLAIALADTAAITSDRHVAIGRVYQNYLQCVVRTGGPVQTLGDLAGRPVSVGAPRSGSAFTTRRILDASGLTSGSDAVVATELTLDAAVTALADGEVDAFFWSGGIPTPQIERLGETTPVALLELSGALPALSAAHPGLYLPATVPAGVYGASRSVGTVGVPNLLVARADLSDAVAGALVDVLVEDAERLVPDDAVGVQFLTSSNLIDTGPLPLHPAAERRYRERYG